MKKHLKGIVATFMAMVLLLAFVLPSFASEQVVQVPIEGTFRYDNIREVLELVNEQRSILNREPLTLGKNITEAAMQRAAELFLYFEHIRPDNDDWSTVLDEYSVERTSSGENIAIGQTSPAAAMDSWVNSPGHFANLTKATYSNIGIGCFYMDGMYYWVQLFTNVEEDYAPADTAVEDTKTVKTLDSRINLTMQIDVPSDVAVGDILNSEIVLKNVDLPSGNNYFSRSLNYSNSYFDFSTNNPEVLEVVEDKLVVKSGGEVEVTATLKSDVNVSVSATITIAMGLEPTTEPVATTEPTTEPIVTTEPTTEPVVTTEPTTEPIVTTEPTTEPVVTTEPTTEPAVTTEPTTEPIVTTEPTTEPVVTTEPTTEPIVTTEPTTEPVVTTEPTEPTTEPVVTTEPTTEPVVTTEPTEPTQDSTEPTQATSEQTEPPTTVPTQESTQKPTDSTQQPTETAETTGVNPSRIKGDPNNDTIINLKDVLWIQQYVAGKRTEYTADDLWAADVDQFDGVGVVNIRDALLLQKYIAKIVTEFNLV